MRTLLDFAPLHRSSVGFDRVFDINVKALWACSLAAGKHMRERGSGSIINIASASGLKAVMPQLALYTASKGAVRTFSKAVAWEYTAHNIRVNSVYPGLIETSLNAEFLKDPATRRMMLGNTMFDRAGTCAEVSEAVAFLASPAASLFVGQTLGPNSGDVML